MSKKDRSLGNSRDEAKKIYYQRKEINRLQQENQQLKEQLKDENNYHNEAVKWYKEAFDTEQENQQLKKANEILKENAIHNDKVVDDTNWKIKQYKSVLDEIREQLKLERKLALSLNKPYTVSVIDKILDKVR